MASEERAALEAAIIQAALAERRACNALYKAFADVTRTEYSPEDDERDATRTAYEAAVDALLAFLGEGTDAK
ncbi:MAG: hypothetical protein M0R22_07575 [Dehalococcoidia bacterium]|jgi:uncharacterized protein with von Willebrand factor type A (vWA) domain|nr:hypothetical protein [Dehalococcoidia bacterium]